MADLEANFMHLQLLHESLGRFNECFSGLLYGLEVRAFCVDFGEVSFWLNWSGDPSSAMQCAIVVVDEEEGYEDGLC